KLVQELYLAYTSRLLAYTRKNYSVPEDDAMNLVYKTIYRIADVYDRYRFDTEKKRSAFVFKTYINYLRNYYRDNKSFENRNFEVELSEFESVNEEAPGHANPKLSLLQHLLDKMEDWERILLLMRGQDIPYSEISKFVNRPENQLKVYYARLKKKLLDDMNEILNKGKSEE
ncbi:MAG: sigma-70 family RNA polymerase sigma factor, partial [Bacteroidia bacterium]|nr:sigma-70 family RNA polymerase sigma factor [Bacteroidia bacterium]